MAALAEICDSRTPAPSDELHLPAELVPKRLYLGGVEAAKDLPALAALGVATVVNCAPDTCARLTGERYYDGLDALPGRGAVRYVEVGASDWMGYPLLERHTVEICEAIEEQKEQEQEGQERTKETDVVVRLLSTALRDRTGARPCAWPG